MPRISETARANANTSQGLSSEDSVSEAEFTTAMRQVAFSVALVTGCHGATRGGLTATSISPVSALPPILLVCVNGESEALSLIMESGAFAVNYLAEAQHSLARLFSTSGADSTARFTGGSWSRFATGAPVLSGATANFDCRLEECIPFGSHRLLLGRVVATATRGEDGLLYRDRQFRRLAP